MNYLIIRSLSIFIIVLEIILFFYIFLRFLPIQKIGNVIEGIVEPILKPIRFLLKHSVFQSGSLDSSPIIAFIVLTYFGQLLSLL